MRPLVLCLVVVFAGVGLGCDSTPNPLKEGGGIPTIEEVQLSVSTGIDSRQSISAHRGPDGEFESRGNLLLWPGSQDIALEVYADTGSVTGDVLYGVDGAILRFEMADTLRERIIVKGGDPNLTPLFPEGRSSATDRKRSPEPAPGVHLCVNDTSAARGSLRLVLEQYGDLSDHTEQEPLRVDFDATFPLRTVPYLERSTDPYCWENGG